MPINSFLYPTGALPSAYTIDNSLRFDDGSSDYLNKTFGSAGSTTKATTSFWIKRSGLTVARGILNWAKGANVDLIRLEASDELRILFNSAVSGSINTSRLFRDVSAWYHVVFAIDTTQSTASDRVKIYVNGVQETSFSSETYPPLNYVLGINSATLCEVGRYSTGYYDGYLAEFVHIDGQQLDPTSFGEFDEDSGIWKPIDVSGLTFGTNGFYLDFENSGSLGADVSGNGNNFTVNNLTSIDQTTDTPTNNYCTWNPLDNYASLASNVLVLSNGNLTASTTSSYFFAFGTLGVSQGKWYWETKLDAESASNTGGHGIKNLDVVIYNDYPTAAGSKVYAYLNDGQKRIDGTNSSFGNALDAGDIVSHYLDMDNGKYYVAKNGVLENSADLDAGTGFLTSGLSGTFTPVVYDPQSANTMTYSANFGNPPYSITSGNSDANDYGNFEYSVPSGYYALNTKNLAEYG